MSMVRLNEMLHYARNATTLTSSKERDQLARSCQQRSFMVTDLLDSPSQTDHHVARDLVKYDSRDIESRNKGIQSNESEHSKYLKVNSGRNHHSCTKNLENTSREYMSEHVKSVVMQYGKSYY